MDLGFKVRRVNNGEMHADLLINFTLVDISLRDAQSCRFFAQ